MDNVASPKKEGLSPVIGAEQQSGEASDDQRLFDCSFIVIVCFLFSDGDKEATGTRLAPPVAAEALLNGTECDSPTHNNLPTGITKTLPLLSENGTSDSEPPHASVTGSNGLILTKQLQQQEAAAPGAPPHRTNRSPPASPMGHQSAKPLPAVAPAGGAQQDSGALRTAPVTGAALGQGTPDVKNGPASPPVPTSGSVTVHRARKTMSRPAVSPAQKVGGGVYYISYNPT